MKNKIKLAIGVGAATGLMTLAGWGVADATHRDVTSPVGCYIMPAPANAAADPAGDWFRRDLRLTAHGDGTRSYTHDDTGGIGRHSDLGAHIAAAPAGCQVLPTGWPTAP